MRHLEPCSILLLATLLLAPLGCRKSEEAEEPAEIETTDVSLPPDALVDPSLDPVERRAGGTGLSGVLPSDFPSGLPTPAGASIVDLEDRSVVFMVARPPAAVEASYRSRLRSAGWSSPGDGRWTRDGEAARVSFEADGPSTRVEVSY